MLSNSFKIIIVISVIFAVSCVDQAASPEPEQKVAPIKEPVPEKKEPEVQSPKPGNEVATYAVPKMDEGSVKGLIGAIADDKGVLEAKPDESKSTLAVTFVPGKTNPKKILEALVKVVPDITLGKIEAASPGEAPAHDCGGCPMRNSCQGGH